MRKYLKVPCTREELVSGICNKCGAEMPDDFGGGHNLCEKCLVTLMRAFTSRVLGDSVLSKGWERDSVMTIIGG